MAKTLMLVSINALRLASIGSTVLFIVSVFGFLFGVVTFDLGLLSLWGIYLITSYVGVFVSCFLRALFDDYPFSYS